MKSVLDAGPVFWVFLTGLVWVKRKRKEMVSKEYLVDSVDMEDGLHRSRQERVLKYI